MSRKIKVFLTIFFLVWIGASLPAVFYGTQKLALHMSYIGDEQSPINGALKMLEHKSLLGMRDAQTVYYGPLFSVIALPAVLGDFGEKLLLDKVDSPLEYRDYILWNWGGIVWKARLISLLACLILFYIVYRLFNTVTLNPARNTLLPTTMVVLTSTSFLIFNYGHFFRHWIFLLVAVAGMIYTALRLYESGDKRYYLYSILFTGFGFGISYLSSIFAVVWLPLLVMWLTRKDWREVKRFTVFGIALVACLALIVAWNPRPFWRVLGLSSGDIANTDTSAFSAEASPLGFSFSYYGDILLNNEAPLVFLVVILSLYLCVRARLYARISTYIVLTPLIIFGVLFGALGHHESRYLVPFVFLLLMYTGMLLGIYFDTGTVRNRYMTIAVFTFISGICALNLLLSAGHVVNMLTPHEEMKLVREIEKLQQENPHARTLLVKHYLLGAPHTKDAYADYMNKTGKSGLNLYKTLLTVEPPADRLPLNVYYAFPVEFTATEDVISAYDHVVYYYEFAREQRMEPDYLDVNAANLFAYRDLSDFYYFIKK